MRKFMLATTIAASLSTGALAADPIYVLRPPTVPSAAKVLPQDAFGAAPSTPSNPTTPTIPSEPAAGADYISQGYAYYRTIPGIPAYTATISLAKDTWYRLPRPAPAEAPVCHIQNSEPVVDLPFWNGGSLNYITIWPKKTGHYQLAIYCTQIYDPKATEPPSMYLVATVDLTANP